MGATEPTPLKNTSLDKLIDALERDVLSGEGRDPTLVGIAIQYQVAKTQRRWTWVSAGIAVASVLVAIAAVIVAAIK